MKILDLFIAAFIPVLKHLNKVVFYFCNPALIGSSLAEHMTAEGMGMLWFMPLNILVTFIVGSALGWIVLKTTKAPYDLWGLVLGCCAAVLDNFYGIEAIYMWSYVYNIVRMYSSCTNSEGEKLDNSTENVTPMEETTQKLSKSRKKPLLPLNGCSAVKGHLNHFDHDCSITARKPQVG
ncbi:hypothetical protein CICLE_v10003371mg [Citrus x clementina]|uniref:Uncharacterized protein n=1 Tax=Citrus clementina TaxID=85681 RepID=V4T5E5_CITCL|nr:hypothetical protein CICLE_v10003371mg [Citrus x clementina]